MQEKPWNLAHCTIAPGRHVVGLGPIEVGDEVEYQVTNGSVRIRRVGCTSTPGPVRRAPVRSLLHEEG